MNDESPSPGAESPDPKPALAAGKSVVVALIGLPGAGKSVVARALEDQLGLRRVCRDAIRHAMFPKCAYSFAEKRAAFRAMLLALEINCLLGESSVLDGVTFSRRRDLLRVDAAIRRYGFAPIPIFLECPPEVARARIAADVANDRHLARDRTPDAVTEVLSRFDAPPPNALVIDACKPATDVCRLAVDAVAALRGTKPRGAGKA
ncbi:MAG: ATP-binding protein [Xanthomonadaceae bacterium]|nr:ATP-binding protein [Xanthomonadaceae bacterium]